MKKIFGILITFILLILTSCKNQEIEINKVIEATNQYNASEVVDAYGKVEKYSCAVAYGTRTSLISISYDNYYSGTVVSKDNNEYYIITYNELLNSKTNQYRFSVSDKVKVYSNAKSEFDGTIVGVDTKNLLALIYLNSSTFNKEAASFSTSSYTKGENVISCTTQLNLESINSISKGVLSRYSGYQIQTDCTVNPSSFGGGIYNLNGELLGIVTGKNYSSKSDKEYIQGMTFATMSKYVSKSVDDMLSQKTVKRSTFGISSIQYNDIVVSGSEYQFPLPTNDKAYMVIFAVEDDGNAKRAGLQPGDIVVSIDNIPTNVQADLAASIHFACVGDTLSFSILRYSEANESFSDLTISVLLK